MKRSLFSAALLSATLFVSTAVMLTGCSSSSEQMLGGRTEYLSTESLSSDQLVLKEYLQASRLKMMSLTIRLSHQCIAGQLDVGYRLLDKTEQEVGGQMYADAFISLTHLDRQIRKLECISNYIDGRFGCNETNKVAVLRDWYKEGPFDQCQDATLITDLTPVNLINEPKSQKGKQNPSYTIITETLHDFDQATLKAIYYPSLDKLVTLMKAFPDSTLVITGHADSRGSNGYNQTLSLARAKQVADYFIRAGIAEESITIKAVGETALRLNEGNSTQQVFNRFTKISLRLVLPSQLSSAHLVAAEKGKESYDE